MANAFVYLTGRHPSRRFTFGHHTCLRPSLPHAPNLFDHKSCIFRAPLCNNNCESLYVFQYIQVNASAPCKDCPKSAICQRTTTAAAGLVHEVQLLGTTAVRSYQRTDDDLSNLRAPCVPAHCVQWYASGCTR